MKHQEEEEEAYQQGTHGVEGSQDVDIPSANVCLGCGQTLLWPVTLVLDVRARCVDPADRTGVFMRAEVRLYVWLGPQYQDKQLRDAKLGDMKNLRDMECIDAKPLRFHPGGNTPEDDYLQARLENYAQKTASRNHNAWETFYPRTVKLPLKDVIPCACNPALYQLIEWRVTGGETTSRSYDDMRCDVVVERVTGDGRSLDQQVIDVTIRPRAAEQLPVKKRDAATTQRTRTSLSGSSSSVSVSSSSPADPQSVSATSDSSPKASSSPSPVNINFGKVNSVSISTTSSKESMLSLSESNQSAEVVTGTASSSESSLSVPLTVSESESSWDEDSTARKTRADIREDRRRFFSTAIPVSEEDSFSSSSGKRTEGSREEFRRKSADSGEEESFMATAATYPGLKHHSMNGTQSSKVPSAPQLLETTGIQAAEGGFLESSSMLERSDASRGSTFSTTSSMWNDSSIQTVVGYHQFMRMLSASSPSSSACQPEGGSPRKDTRPPQKDRTKAAARSSWGTPLGLAPWVGDFKNTKDRPAPRMVGLGRKK